MKPSKIFKRLLSFLSVVLILSAAHLPQSRAQSMEKQKQEKPHKKKAPALSLLQFRASPSVYMQFADEANGIAGATSFSTTLAWAPSFKITPRIYIRAQGDITPLNTTEGLAFAPGASLGVMVRFTSSWAVEVDGGAQFWSVGAWPLLRSFVLFSPKGFGLSEKIPLRFHAGYQPLLWAVTTHGVVAGVEIAFL
jgi:hypothetical protein